MADASSVPAAGAAQGREGTPGVGASCFRIAVMLPRCSMYGGVEQFGFRLAEALAARGHQVDFLCARQEGEPPKGVRVRSVGRPPGGRALKLLWFLQGAERLRRKGDYDLTISLGKTWQQDVSRMGGGPLRIFWEKSEKALAPGWPRTLKRIKRRLSPVNWLTFLVEKRQFTERSEVIAVSHLVREWLLRAYPALRPERVQVVYNRPDATRFFPPDDNEREEARRELAERYGFAAAPERVLIGTASTNFELKGVAPLIRAVARLPEHAVLLVAGGREHGAYTALAEELGVSDRVIFCGKVTDMPGFYRALDIFILPTFYDACSNAVLEALASGCRVLTSDSNGAAFFLAEEQIFPDPGDAEELAKRLFAAMRQPRPAPFIWPDSVPSGMEAFVGLIEKKLAGSHEPALRAQGVV